MSDQPRPFKEFRDVGLLWLVNRSVFHPRGFALTFHTSEDGSIIGWSLQGDGSEPWTFSQVEDSEAFKRLRESGVIRTAAQEERNV